MEMVKWVVWVNMGLRFGLELAALLGLGYWGFTLERGIGWRVLLGIGAPLLAAILWGTFVSPKARIPLREPWRFAVEAMVFGAAVLALVAAGRPVWGIGLGVLYLVNRLLLMATGGMKVV
jgi:hypothetical protein